MFGTKKEVNVFFVIHLFFITKKKQFSKIVKKSTLRLCLVLGKKEKNDMKNNFSIFGCLLKNLEENQI